jgi:hypothetical protein
LTKSLRKESAIAFKIKPTTKHQQKLMFYDQHDSFCCLKIGYNPNQNIDKKSKKNPSSIVYLAPVLEKKL